MVVTGYDGHKHTLKSGSRVQHYVKDDGILLVVISPHGDSQAAFLRNDEARKLATTLLRDVGLNIDGGG